jgi:hypothetical protein
MEPVVKPQVDGTIQYIEWLILNDRVQPSFIAGVGNPQVCIQLRIHHPASTGLHRTLLAVLGGHCLCKGEAKIGPD